MTPADKFLPRLDRVRERGKFQWTAICPAHEDKSPSLSIRVAEDGRLLLICFAGCSAAEIVAAVGLELSDLFPDDPNRDPAFKPRKPRLDGWTVISLLQHRLSMIYIAADDMIGGKPISEDDLKDLREACAEVKSMLEVAHEIR
jgi:hypothetical protein